jgi:hypothetical protein
MGLWPVVLSGTERSNAGALTTLAVRLDVAYQMMPRATRAPTAMPSIMLLDMAGRWPGRRTSRGSREWIFMGVSLLCLWRGNAPKEPPFLTLY